MKRFYCFIVLLIFMSGSAVKASMNLGRPDAVGGGLVGTRQDASQIGSSGIGPGIEFFVKYNASPKIFVTAGLGISTIYDKILTWENFKTTLLPDLEVKAAYKLSEGSTILPFLYGGLCVFRHSTEIKGLGSTDPYFDGGVFVGGGIEYPINEAWTFHLTADYRYILSSDADEKPVYYVGKAGLSYAIPRGDRPIKREEMEYPLDNGEIASLDELFNEKNTSSGDEDEDALALLFEPEASESATNETTYPDTEKGQMMQKIDNVKSNMNSKLNEMESLEERVAATEKAIADLSSTVAGEYTGYKKGSFGVENEEVFKQNYEVALQTFYAHKYKDAVQLFEQLLSTNPDNRLASNCQYWIGESYNAMGNYRQAIEYFNAVMRYKSSYKFDDALIMNGLCQMKLGNTDRAREQFQELMSRYPDSEYAPKAMRYLGRL